MTIRDVTERPETTECGSNILSGADPDLIVKSLKLALRSKGLWAAPEEYTKKNVANTVAKIVLSYKN